MGKKEDEFSRLKENWDLYTGLVESKISNPILKEPLVKLCKKLEDRLAVCPASTKTEYVGAFNGGLVWHSLNVLKAMKDLNKVYDSKYSPDSLILVSLFHDIGKIGNEEEDYYLVHHSDWHRKNGFAYEVNKSLTETNVTARTFWWLNSNNIPMDEEEIHAIMSLNQMGQMWNSELYHIPMLTLMLQQSIRFCCNKYKNHDLFGPLKNND
jgi:hypothetical protein